MSEHYTSNTVSVAKWCNKHRRQTQHRVNDHRVNICLECQEEEEKKYQQRRALAIETAVDTQAQRIKRELLRREGIALPAVEMEVPCPCSAYPFPHFHSEGERRLARIRFNNRQPLPTREEFAQ